MDAWAAGTIEAKRKGAALTGVEVQSSRYAQGLPPSLPAWTRPLPFRYESTGAETHFTNGLDPEPRARSVFAFHRPETLAAWLALLPIGSDAEGAGQVHRAAPTFLAQVRHLPALAEEGEGLKLWPAQVKAIRNLERSLAANKPRALIQMATGSGKTFTAISFIYRLIKFAGARRVLFLVDRGNLGDQTLKEFQQYASPYNNFKFTEEYIVQRLTSNTLDTTARVCICTIQRLYSMLKGKELPEDLEEESVDRLGSLVQAARAHRLQPRHPHRDLRHHRHRRMPPLHLQPLGAGAGVLRRLPHRSYRHAQQADLRLLPPEPGDGIQPRDGRGRRRQRQLRRLPHRHPDHRSGSHGRGRLLGQISGPRHPQEALGRAGR